MELPEQLPSGVYILKFQMVDPLILQKKGKSTKEAAFGDVLSVTLAVENGNLGNVLSSKQEKMGGIVGFFAQSQNEKRSASDEFPSEEYYDDVQKPQPLKIGDLNLDELDLFIEADEAELKKSVLLD